MTVRVATRARDRLGGRRSSAWCCSGPSCSSSRVAGGWTAARADPTPGSGWRGALLAASLCGGLAPAFALLSRIEARHGHHDGLG